MRDGYMGCPEKKTSFWTGWFWTVISEIPKNGKDFLGQRAGKKSRKTVYYDGRNFIASVGPRRVWASSREVWEGELLTICSPSSLSFHVNTIKGRAKKSKAFRARFSCYTLLSPDCHVFTWRRVVSSYTVAPRNNEVSRDRKKCSL